MRPKKSYQHLNLTEREVTQRHYEVGIPCSEIAEMLGRHRRTIEREIERHSIYGRYDALVADSAYHQARSQASSSAWKMTTCMHTIISTLMKVDRLSPKQIYHWCLQRGIKMVSKTWIYRLIRKDRDNGGTLYKYLRRRGRQRKWRGGKKAGRGYLTNVRNISERPAIVSEKIRLGDGEIDTVEGKGKQSCLVTYVDRVTKYLKIGRVEGLSSILVTAALLKALRPIAPHILTLTADNGKEFARHEEIAKQLSCDFFFCDTYSSWQRGLNENTNGLIRDFFPKGTDFLKVTDEEVQYVEDKLNNRLRETLNWSTPNQAFATACAKVTA